MRKFFVAACVLGLLLGGCASSYQCFCRRGAQRIAVPYSKDVVDSYRDFQDNTVFGSVDKETGVYSDFRLQSYDTWLTEHNCNYEDVFCVKKPSGGK